jgi:hypothetical protein
MKDTIISLGAGKNQIPLIKEIKKNNYKCLAFDTDKFAKGFELADYFAPVSSHNYLEIVEYIKNNNLQEKLIGVLTRSTGKPVVSLAYIGNYFGLNALDLELAKLITDKNKLISRLNKKSIPCPKLFSLDNKGLDTMEFPVFVKPSKTNLSHRGMGVCFSKQELLLSIEKAKQYSETKLVNVEEYLKGYDVVTIDFVVNGEIIHIATIGELTSGYPDFRGIGWYSGFSRFEKPVKETFRRFVEKLNVKAGFFQTATKVDSNFETAKIYEIHGEIGGDFVCDYFLPKVYNQDVFKLNIDFATGKNLKINAKNKHYAVLVFENAVCFEKIQTADKRFKRENGFYLACLNGEDEIWDLLKKLESLNINHKNGEK